LLKEIACLYGKNPINTLPPSSGGIGIILNAARTTLMITLDLNIIIKGISTVALRDSGNTKERGTMINLMIIILPIDRRILVIGPAAAEIAISRLGFLKFIGFIGTGFAYPKTN
jgi:hypothetical protein